MRAKLNKLKLVKHHTIKTIVLYSSRELMVVCVCEQLLSEAISSWQDREWWFLRSRQVLYDHVGNGWDVYVLKTQILLNVHGFCHGASYCTPNVEITALTADNFVYNISTEACFVFSRWEPRAQEIRYVEYPSFVKSVLANWIYE